MTKTATKYTLDMSIVCNQRGNARLKASLITSGVMISAVLLYQLSLSRAPETAQPRDNGSIDYGSVQLFAQSMPVLAQGAYELVVVGQDGARTSLGRFLLTDQGQIADLAGTVKPNAVFPLRQRVTGLSKAEIRLVDRQDNRQPFSIEFLTGDFQQDRAVATFGGSVFEQSSGRYMVGTPTDGNDTLNERSGLWFGDLVRGAAALNLPTLKPGWVYEGWAVLDGRPLTTGRFTSVNRPDSFSGFSDAQSPAPNFPGEDFLRDPPVQVFPGLAFPLDLAGDLVRISLEPDVSGIDPTGQGPFGLTVLESEIPNRADPRRLYELDTRGVNAPKATVVLR